MAANRARHYFYNGQTDQAEYWLLRAQEMWERSLIKSRGRVVDNYIRLRAISLQKGNPSQAMKYLQDGFRIDARNPDVLKALDRFM